MAYSLEAIRKLLSDAFSGGGIKTLAFDRFYEIYDDFASGMTKGQMIEAIVENAHKNGCIPDLLDYVSENNPHQYRLYAPQLEIAEPVRQAKPIRQFDFGYEQRVQDLQRHIDSAVDLLNEYEEQLEYEDDPRRLKRIGYNIKRQKKTIAGYTQEAAEIQTNLAVANAPDVDAVQKQLGDITQQLSAMSKQINNAENRLADGQYLIRNDIRKQKEAVLAHIDGAHRQTIAILVDKMNADQLELTELMYDAADQQKIAQWEADQLTMLAQHSLHEIKQVRKSQIDTGEWDSLLSTLTNETGWEQKLKLTLPIIPLILEFESEIATDIIPSLRQVWDKLVKKARSLVTVTG